MRRLSPLLALLFVSPALADTLDCAVIKSTTHPFEIAFDWIMTQKDKDPLAVQMHRPVIRKADQTIVYEYFLAEKFTRRTLNPAGFRIQVRGAGRDDDDRNSRRRTVVQSAITFAMECVDCLEPRLVVRRV